jgi:DNA polymerase III subunit alpha
VGASVCQEIIKTRQAGRFKDLHDFIQRLSQVRPNKRVLEALIDSGALDSLSAHRALLHAELADALKAAEKQQRDLEAGQFDMFGNSTTSARPQRMMLDVLEFNWVEKLQKEKAVLGGYFSGHPLDQQRAEFDSLGCPKLIEIAGRTQPESRGEEKRRFPETSMLVAGEIEAIRRRDTMSFAKFSDGSGATLEVGFFKDAMLRFGDLLKEGERLLVAGMLSWDPFSSGWQLKVKQAYTLDQGLGKSCTEVRIHTRAPGQSFVQKLTEVLSEFSGGHARIIVELEFPEGRVALELGAAWRVRGLSELKARLKKIGGIIDVELRFDAARLFEADTHEHMSALNMLTEQPRYHIEASGDDPEIDSAAPANDEAELMAFADPMESDSF